MNGRVGITTTIDAPKVEGDGALSLNDMKQFSKDGIQAGHILV